MTRWRLIDAVFSTACFLALGGCSVGPKYLPPVAPAPAVYKESPTQVKETGDNPPGEWTVAQPQDATLRGKWWEIYNEPDLNALEEQLNVDNQNIREAFENFMEARALVREPTALPMAKHSSCERPRLSQAV